MLVRRITPVVAQRSFWTGVVFVAALASAILPVIHLAWFPVPLALFALLSFLAVRAVDPRVGQLPDSTNLALLETVLEQLPVGVIFVDRTGRGLRHNRRVHEIFALDPEMTSPHIAEFMTWQIQHPDGGAATLEELPLARAMTLGETVQSQSLRVRQHDNDPWTTVDVSAAPVLDGKGQMLGAVSVFTDQRQRAAQEQRLRLLESAVVHARDAIVILEAERNNGPGRSVLYVNDAFCRMTGYHREEVVGRSLSFLRGPRSDPATLEQLRTSLEQGQALQAELLNYRKDGSELWVELSLVPVHDGSQRCTHWVMIQRDISDRKRAEEDLRRSEERYRMLFDSNPQPMWVYDRDTSRFLAVNDAAVRTYGYGRGEFLGMTVGELRPIEETHLPGSVVATGLCRHQMRNGGILEVELSSHPVTFDGRPAQLVLANDVTERRRLEEQLRHAQKMETVGQMAGGIAHDFNNLLTGVIGNLSRVDLPCEDPNRPLIATAERAAARAADLTRKLLGFARKNQLLLAPVRVSEFAGEVVDLVRRTCDPRVEVQVDFAAQEPVAGDAALINQALLNLCLNARDAMPHGGILRIRAETVELTEAEAAAHPEARSGTFVRLSVEDTGTGITTEVQPRLFEPFFTTKPVGQGTGLGLAMVHGIVKQHKGWIAYETELGHGTRFDLFLPVAVAATTGSGAMSRMSTERLPMEPAVTPAPVAEPGGTILLVDDEEMIRDLGRSVLELAGYTVVEAHDGMEAVEVFTRDSSRFDLVILDLTMPRLSGRDAFRSMIAIDPTARILFSSGYSADDLSDVTGAIGLLAKPYRPQELLSAVQHALSSRPAVTSSS